MFKKIVAIEPISLIKKAEEELSKYSKEVILYEDIPKNDEEIIKRINDADCVLLSYTSTINKNILENCKNINYIGMCCSLYSEQSANVDIRTARENGITVLGIRDYGDEGVVEYVISELVRILHGFGNVQWKELPLELTDLKVGIIGLGTSGTMIAKGLKYFGSDLYYFSRTRKSEDENEGIKYLSLKELLNTVDVVCTCLNKNVILLHNEEFEALGNNKILFNTSIGPSFDIDALTKWLDNKNNYFFCDTKGALGDINNTLINNSNVFCMDKSVGRTKQAFDRLSQKVLDNIKQFLNEK